MENKNPIYKYRLFVKIYLWFWLVTLVMVASVVVVDRMHRPEPPEHFRDFIGRVLSQDGQAALKAMDSEGVAGLDNYVRRIRETTGNRLFLFEGERMIGGDEVPDEVRSLAAAAAGSADGHRALLGDKGLAAMVITGRNGRRYVLVERMPPPPPHEFSSHPPPPPPGSPSRPPLMPPPFDKPGSSLLLQIMAALLVSGLVCYLLTRYMISPIVKLREATRQLASGNLSVRVSSAIGGRRDELSQLARDFDIMAERIESLMVSQRNLLRDISHELRSPLARLNVALELCRKRCDPETEKSLDRISRESEKLNELIGQILALNRADSGISGLEMTIFSLAILVREIVEDANFEARTGNRSVVITACDECTVRGDRQLLRSAVENVVRNAVLHTPEGTQVEVSLHLESRGPDSFGLLKVRDHGDGVPEEEMANLFKPFYRVHDGKDRSGGAGIGLTIARSAVQLHGGEITVANADSGGLIVEIVLPSG